jgi:hypothetical protein
MTLTDELQPWLFPVEPLEGESFSHFLGRVSDASVVVVTEVSQVWGEV